MSADFSICVLISGGGTTLRNLIETKNRGDFTARIAHVISSNRKAGGLDFAKAAEIPFTVVSHREHSETELAESIFSICRDQAINLVVLGGFLRKLVIPDDFRNRVVNIHPSLIPAFCGRGFYGKKVHRSAIDYGVKISGCTVHFVDNQFDHGPIIAQSAVPVLPSDTPEELAARVFEQECVLYPETIDQIAAGRVQVSERTVTLLPPSNRTR